MTRKLVEFWVWFAVVFPALIGLVLLFYPDSLFSNGIEILDISRMVAIRNLVYSAILLAAVLTQPKKVVGILMFGRGLTDLADATSNVIAKGYIDAPVLVPLSLAIISFYVSYYLLSKSK